VLAITGLFPSLGDATAGALTGAVGGAIGSFLRESAWLYTEVHSRRKNKVIPLLFIPLWVICGALFGGMLGAQYGISMFYACLAGAAWRQVISNTRVALSPLPAGSWHILR
jgi:hypothetical protein